MYIIYKNSNMCGEIAKGVFLKPQKPKIIFLKGLKWVVLEKKLNYGSLKRYKNVVEKIIISYLKMLESNNNYLESCSFTNNTFSCVGARKSLSTWK